MYVGVSLGVMFGNVPALAIVSVMPLNVTAAFSGPPELADRKRFDLVSGVFENFEFPVNGRIKRRNRKRWNHGGRIVDFGCSGRQLNQVIQFRRRRVRLETPINVASRNPRSSVRHGKRTTRPALVFNGLTYFD